MHKTPYGSATGTTTGTTSVDGLAKPAGKETRETKGKGRTSRNTIVTPKCNVCDPPGVSDPYCASRRQLPNRRQASHAPHALLSGVGLRLRQDGLSSNRIGKVPRTPRYGGRTETHLAPQGRRRSSGTALAITYMRSLATEEVRPLPGRGKGGGGGGGRAVLPIIIGPDNQKMQIGEPRSPS